MQGMNTKIMGRPSGADPFGRNGLCSRGAGQASIDFMSA
jgi:hypothetical protein